MTRSPFRRSGIAAAVAASFALAGCDGGSGGPDSAPPALASQAVDGFIVGAGVACDGVPNGGTAAGGRLVCPAGTVLASVRGGSDVGFDETATTGGMPFVGELVAPAALGWVTPLTSIAVAMASDADGYDPARFGGAVDDLAAALDRSALDLSADPTRIVDLARLNGQVHQLVGAFGASEEAYREATVAFAALLSESAANGRAWGLDGGTDEVLRDLNTRLAASGSSLAMSESELEQVAARVREVNGAIANATDLDTVFGAAVAAPLAGQALTIDRDRAVIGYGNNYSDTRISLAGFENDEQIDGFGGLYIADSDGSLTDSDPFATSYVTVIDGSGRLSLNDRAFGVERTLVEQPVSIGFAFEATDEGDDRAIAVTTSDALVSATEGESDSVAIVLPEGTTLRVRSVSDDATVTTATLRLKNEHEFLSESGGIDLSFWRIDRELESRGFGDLTARAGNYRMTVAIGGLEINEREDGEMRRTPVRTVDSGDEVVSGSGFEGYVTIVPSDYWYYY